jgi:hypothetical protein
MIDAREVRAGNWVLKITGISKNTRSFLEYKVIGPDEYYSTFATVCFPILITPAILGNCGFKHEFGDWYINRMVEGIDEGLPFLRFRLSDESWYFEKSRLTAQPVYLHQLQNLYYALLHQELNIHLDRFQNADIMGPVEFFLKPRWKQPRKKELL